MASLFEAVAGNAIGYPAGLGGAVIQGTSKATPVTLNKVAGAITMDNVELAGGDEVSFVVTNSFVAATDVPVLAIKSVNGSTGTYVASVSAVADGSFTITLSNLGGTASEVLVINFVVIKAAAS
jgi:hypothetical protein